MALETSSIAYYELLQLNPRVPFAELFGSA